jgi:peptidoglycan/xylan/chitin deacetylase (PgdA/CDA1 family)
VPSFQGELTRQERWARLPGLERVEGAEDAVALTFDDGPDPEGTPEVLDALEACGARATFFVLGEQLMRSTRLGRELTNRGHEVALHGHGHVHHDQLSPREARDDLARGLGTAEVASGRRPRWYRPPYGVFSEASYGACRDLGLEPVYWSAWGIDWEAVPAERIADLAVRDLEPGAILVLHDSARYAPRDDVRPTVEAIAPIAAAAQERGLRLVSLEEATRRR